MKLNPHTIRNRLVNAQLNPDVIDEIVTAIQVKNTLDDIKKDKGYPEGYNFGDLEC